MSAADELERLRAERDALKAAIERALALAAEWKAQGRKESARMAEANKVTDTVRNCAWATAYECHATDLRAALRAPDSHGDES